MAQKLKILRLKQTAKVLLLWTIAWQPRGNLKYFWFFRMASFELNPVLRHEVNLIWTSRSFLEGANLNLPLNFFLNGFGHFFLGKTLRFVIGTSSNLFCYILCLNAVIFKNVIRSKCPTFVANTHFGFHSRNVILPKYL